MSPPASRRLVVFTRLPVPGETKTRLIPALGPEGAAELARRMAGTVLATARNWCERADADLEVRMASGDAAAWGRWPGGGFPCRPQGAGDLGARMLGAFRDAAREGAGATAIVGSDCPFVTGRHLDEAFGTLERGAPLVLGPAVDGGYWLIGLREPVEGLFGGMPWGTERVLAETLRRAAELGLEPRLLEELPDVDRPGDLGRLRDGPVSPPPDVWTAPTNRPEPT